MWEKFSPMLGALLGSLITGGLMLVGQIAGAYFEDTRKLRNLAYESAMQEWQTRAKFALENGSNLPTFGDILLEHIEYSYVVRRYGADLVSEEFAGIILDSMLEKYQQDDGLEQHSSPNKPSPKSNTP